MAKDIEDRVTQLENKVSSNSGWEKVKILIPLCIPLSIAAIGWYFTNEHNKNQIEIALVNSTVSQSSLIKDFIPHLNSTDSTEKNIAMIALLYAAPAPGKEIVELIAASANTQEKNNARSALTTKRKDLVNKLFSFQKEIRIIAANEIIASWTTDEELILDVVLKAKGCLEGENEVMDCNNGVFNSLIVLNNCPEEVLKKKKEEISRMIQLIPASSVKTWTQGNKLTKKMN